MRLTIFCSPVLTSFCSEKWSKIVSLPPNVAAYQLKFQSAGPPFSRPHSQATFHGLSHDSGRSDFGDCIITNRAAKGRSVSYAPSHHLAQVPHEPVRIFLSRDGSSLTPVTTYVFWKGTKPVFKTSQLIGDRHRKSVRCSQILKVDSIINGSFSSTVLHRSAPLRI